MHITLLSSPFIVELELGDLDQAGGDSRPLLLPRLMTDSSSLQRGFERTLYFSLSSLRLFLRPGWRWELLFWELVFVIAAVLWTEGVGGLSVSASD
jgi:hypothetical protein